MTAFRALGLAATVALALGLGGCAGQTSGDPGGPGGAGKTGNGGTSGGDTVAVGVWGEPDTTGRPYLELMEDRSLAGSDGCNRLAGRWEQAGDTVDFGQLASTMMFCEGVDTWLSAAASATISGSTMTVLDDTGAPIGTLQRN